MRREGLTTVFLLGARKCVFTPAENRPILLVRSTQFVKSGIGEIGVPIGIEDHELSAWLQHSLPFAIRSYGIAHEPGHIAQHHRIIGIRRKRKRRDIAPNKRNALGATGARHVLLRVAQHLLALINGMYGTAHSRKKDREETWSATEIEHLWGFSLSA